MTRNPLDDRSRHGIGRPIPRRLSVPGALAICAAVILIYVSSGLTSDAPMAGADPASKGVPIGSTTNQVKARATSAPRLPDVHGAWPSSADDESRRIKRNLLSSGSISGGTSSKFQLNRAPGDRPGGTVGQFGVGSGSSESMGASGGFWQGLGGVRGDVNGDGAINVGDVVHLVNFLYRYGAPPIREWAGDFDCDGATNVGDVVQLVNYLYRNGPAPSC